MSVVPQVPLLRNHPAVQKTRALSQSPNDPVGALSLFRLRLAHPELGLNVLLFQALDVLLWVTSDRVIRLHMQGSGGNLQGLLVLSSGCLCTLDLNSAQTATLQFELYGRRGLLQYDETADSGVWFQPATEPLHNLRPWPELCEPSSEEEHALPLYSEVETTWRAALNSLAGQTVWAVAEGRS